MSLKPNRSPGISAVHPKQSKPYRRVGISALYLSAGQYVGVLNRIILLVAAAFYLGPELYGMYQVGQAWYLAWLPVAGGGLQFLLAREIGYDPNASVRIVFPTLLLRLGLVSLAAAGCLVTAPLFQEGRPWILLAIFAMALGGRSIASWCTAVFNAHQYARYELSLALRFRLLETVAAVLALVMGQGILVLATIHALSWWLQAGAGLWLVHTRVCALKPVWAPATLWHLLVRGAPLSLGALTIAWQMQGPLLIFNRYAETGEHVGHLALLMQVFSMAAIACLSFAVALLPALSAEQNTGGGNNRFVALVLRIGIVLGTYLMLAGWAIGNLIIETLFGEQFLGDPLLIGLALALTTPFFFGNTLWQAFIAHRRVAAGVACGLGGAVVSTGAVLVLVQRYGNLGAVCGAGLGLTIWASSLFCLSPCPPNRAERHAILLASGLWLSAMACYLAIAPQWRSFTLCALTLAVGFASWSFVLLPEERRSLRLTIRKQA